MHKLLLRLRPSGACFLLGALLASPTPGFSAVIIELQQARNGTQDQPETSVLWGKGNAGPTSAHYIETHSIPYRLLLSDLATGPHRLIIEWDTRQNGKHAIDYITHFNRLQPHDLFATHQLPETIHPLDGLSGAFEEARTFAIPAPSSSDSPVAGQPTASFQWLPESERLMTIWNGAITNLAYAKEDPPSTGSSSTRLQIDFISTQPKVVIAWGGHIASQFDWGTLRSASGINGSPYHSRIISLDGIGGNQDLSLQVLPLLPPPPCTISGPAALCPQTSAAYAVANPSLAPGVAYTWSISDQGAGATFVGASSGPFIEVHVLNPGAFTLEVTVSVGDSLSVCSQSVLVHSVAGASPLADQSACAFSEVSFTTVPSGTGPFTFGWTKDGNPIPGATAAALSLGNVSELDEGRYCVEVTGACGTVQRCANLVVYPLPTAIGPLDQAVQCLEEVPPPDPTLVGVEGGLAPFQIEHAGDVPSTNECVITIVRTYQVTDACGLISTCSQLIRVEDTVPPVLECPPDRSVEAGLDWNFDFPTASDNCLFPVGILLVDTKTNQLSGHLFTATRTWRATDACGNFSLCSQTVTIVDTTPPVLACPDNMSFPCPGPEGVEIAFTVTAADLGDPDVQIVCTPPSGTVFPLGLHTVQCQATDATGNQSVCTFTITIFDQDPPSISCPPDMIVAESAPGAMSAVVTFPAPTATDLCDDDPAIVCQPPSGSIFAAGLTSVICTATDKAGNSAVCTFTVQVVPVTIVTTSTADSGPGTLRQALLDANASPGGNIIAFDLPGQAPYTIHLLSPLPEISGDLVLDGTSQPGFILEPVVEVDGGTSVPPPDSVRAGLVVNSGPAIVRGLTLNGFDIGLVLGGSGGHLVEDCFIGMDSNGDAGPGNTLAGILVQSPDNIIGTPGRGNLVSANQGPGIILDSALASGNVLQGNVIGVGADGTSSLGNGGDGILIGNGASRTLLGGLLPGQGNVIAFNGGAGVSIEPAAGPGQSILGNAIAANFGLGIDLGADGVTPNAQASPPEGPAGFPSYPEDLTAFSAGDGTTTVQGTIQGRPGDNLRVECFLNDEPDPSGFGEGHGFMGGAQVGLDAAGLGMFSFSFPVGASPDQWVTATATDSQGNTSEFSAATQVGSPPIIIVQPIGSAVSLGGSAMMCVTAIGTQPLTYQWRRNGANIPQATGDCLFIPNAGLEAGGTYTVVVANRLGAVTSDPAVLILRLPALAAGDNFADRVAIAGLTGLAAGTNIAATREFGEPEHFGKPGGRSVWYTWTASKTGIATFRTTGSTFDTLLAVYSGTELSNLKFEGGDEDSGGYYTSDLRFNAIAGTAYHIAIDGFGGAVGDFVFEWELEPTDHLLPLILSPPQNQTVPLGGTAMFSIQAVNTCDDGHHDCRHPTKHHHEQHDDAEPLLLYQWLFNGSPIPNATNSTLVITDVQTDDIGAYAVLLNDHFISIVSLPAWLQINMTGTDFQPVQSEDKFLDAARSTNPLRLGGFGAPAFPSAQAGTAALGAGAFARGYTGTQVFTTSRSSTEVGDILICDVPGGATEWMMIVPEETGMLHLNTQGSSFDTILAALAYSVTNAPYLDILGCNNNAFSNVTYSAVTVPVVAGQTNFIVVDGVFGAFGTLQLNFSLIVDASFTLVETTPGGVRMRVSGRPNLNLRIEGSPNFTQWSALVTTNSPSGVFEFIDPQSISMPRRYYRAVLLP